MFSTNPDDYVQHPRIIEIIGHATMCLLVLKSINHDLFEPIEKKIQNLPIWDYIKPLYTDGLKQYESLEVSELWDRFETQLNGIPFGDIGEERHISWKQLGTEWQVKWNNDYETTLIAEQFIAFLQIFLTEFAQTDLCLVKSIVKLKIKLIEIEKPKCILQPSKKGKKWVVNFPISYNIPQTDLNRLESNLISICTVLLKEISLLPFNKFMDAFTNCIKKGLSMKIIVGDSYKSIFSFFITEKLFNSIKRKEYVRIEPNRKFHVKENEELKWIDKSYPYFSKEKINEILKGRYKNSYPAIKYTLRELLKAQEFRTLLNKLKKEGWLDWQILTAILGIKYNYFLKNDIKIDKNNPFKPEEVNDTKSLIQNLAKKK